MTEYNDPTEYLEKTLKINVDVHVVDGRIVEDVLEKVASIMGDHKNEFEDVVLKINIS